MNHTGDRMGATVDDTSKCAAPLIEHVFGPVYVLDLFMCGPADWLCNAFDNNGHILCKAAFRLKSSCSTVSVMLSP